MKSEELGSLIVRPDVTIAEALTVLDATGVGMILVCDELRHLLGVLTDGDVRRFLLRNKTLDSSVNEIMNTKFTSLCESAKEQAQHILKNSKFNHMAITDNEGRLVDLVTSLDLLKNTEKSYDNAVVIMAGGKGTRLSPLSQIIPKPLFPAGDKVIIELIIENFRNGGFTNFRIIVNYKKELIKSYFCENNLIDGIWFVEEEAYLGTAGGLALLKEEVRKPIIVTNCDIVAKADYGLMLDWHKEHHAAITILGVRKKTEVAYGVINVNEDNYVISIEEKPNLRYIIMSGIYILEPQVLGLIESGSVCQMDDLINRCIKSGGRVACYPIENGWFDIGQFDGYRILLKELGILGQ